MMELHVCDHEGKLLRAFALGDSNEVIVGRDETCDIRIRAKSVSREHCTIEREGEDYVLRDLSSTSGTFLDGKRVERLRVRHGMAVHIGPAVLRFVESDI